MHAVSTAIELMRQSLRNREPYTYILSIASEAALDQVREFELAAQEVVAWADEGVGVCKYCDERGGSILVEHLEYCVIGNLRSLLENGK